jgi:phosphodiesterase/alkaline phosphatase D-like protein
MDPDGTQYGGDEFFTTLAASQPTPPAVITLTASSLTTTSVVLNGTINGVTSYAVAHFQYGTDTNYTGGQAGTYFTSSTGQTEPFNYPLTGLSPNTTYHYRAFGFNCCAEGFGGDMTFTTATPQPPPTVTTLAAGAINTNSAQLNGAVNPNGAGTTAFFQWGADTNYGNVTTQTGIGTTPQSDFQATLTGLSSSTTYHYRMVANNSSTISYGADASFTTAWAPQPPTLVSPGTPTDTGSTVGTLTPTLTWNGFSQATEYNLMVSAYPSGAVVYSSVLTGTSVQMPGGYLQAGTKYDWSVNSVNSVGEAGANSTPLVFQTASLPSVQTLTPTNGVGDGSVTLLGTVNPNGSGTTVYFEYGPTTSYGTITTQTGIGTTAQTFSALVTGLLRDRTYHYRMDAVNGIGPSQGSDVSFVSP